jgi:hypothetical protein
MKSINIFTKIDLYQYIVLTVFFIGAFLVFGYSEARAQATIYCECFGTCSAQTPLAGQTKCTDITGCKTTPKCSATPTSVTVESSAGDRTLGTKGIAKYIPDCTSLAGQCSDVSIFLITAVGIGSYVFTIIGALALLMFLYGGIIWITSHGNPEKVKKGMEIFVAAVIGLVIVFSAYMLVKYFGDSIIGIDNQYKLK